MNVLLSAAGRSNQVIDLGGRSIEAKGTVSVGRGTVIRNCRVVALRPPSGPVFRIQSPDVVLENVEIDAGGQAGVVAVNVGPGAENVILDHVTATDAFIGYQVLGTSGTPVTDLKLIACQYSHANPASGTSSNALYAEYTTRMLIQDFRSEDSFSDAIALRNQCLRTHVLRGYLARPGRASVNNGNGIDGNSGLIDSLIDGVEVVGAHGSGIVVEDGPFATSNGSHCNNVEIRGCIVRDGVAPAGGKAHGIEIVFKAGGTQLPHDVRVIGGTSENCEGSGMFIIGRLVSVQGHLARGNYEYGYQVAADAVDISFNNCGAVGNGIEGVASWSGLYNNGGLRVHAVGCWAVGKDAKTGILTDADLSPLTQTQRYAGRFDGSATGWHGPWMYGHSDTARPIRSDAPAMVGMMWGNRAALFEQGPGSVYQTTDDAAGADPGDLRVRDDTTWTSVTKT